MPTIIILQLIVYSILTVSAFAPCSIESYLERLNIRDCLITPIEIEVTRCHGQCYSEDFLIYDWKSEPTYYRHKHSMHCCSPNITIPRQIPILCYNNQQRTIQYPIVTRCECKLCPKNCNG
jgi:hypothetical protein